MTETFLDGRVRVTQPGQGFRSGLDAVMLAAAVPARAGENALELGSGAGTASLCLAARIKGIAITGVEIDPSLVALATTNAAANGGDCQFVAVDIFRLPPELKRDFDQVFCNPPFHGEGQVTARRRPRGRAQRWRQVERLVEAWPATHCLRWIFHRHRAGRPAGGSAGGVAGGRRQRLASLAANWGSGQAGDRAGQEGLTHAFCPAAGAGFAPGGWCLNP